MTDKKVICPACGSDKLIYQEVIKTIGLALQNDAELDLRFKEKYYTCTLCTESMDIFRETDINLSKAVSDAINELNKIFAREGFAKLEEKSI